jgi:CheY-like chemotaxis protein
VDDDEAIRRLVRLNLTDLYEIFDAGQPEEALALASEHKPDAILLDLRMPDILVSNFAKHLPHSAPPS